MLRLTVHSGVVYSFLYSTQFQEILNLVLGIALSFLVIVSISTAYSQSDTIPQWVKGIAGFWADDRMTDSEFVEALEFLINQKIINVNDPRVAELEKSAYESERHIKSLESEIYDLQQQLADSRVTVDPYDKSPGDIYDKTKPHTDLEKPAYRMSVFINPATGSGVPGCETTPEGCFIPSTVTVDVGERVIFSNTDYTAHTFTSGDASDPDSVGTVFDSSLALAGSSFEWSPKQVGEQPYFCIVHPWMIGTIHVGSTES